jgi:hypothetical protein
VFLPEQQRVGSGVRDLGDGLLLVGDQAAVIQSKSRTDPTDNVERELSWPGQYVTKALKQFRDSEGAERDLEEPAEDDGGDEVAEAVFAASGATTRSMAPVAAEIIAARPPTIEITTAMVKEANSPMLGSTPAMMEKEIASGISASATTRPARISVRAIFGREPRRRRRSGAGSEGRTEDTEIRPDMLGRRTARRSPRRRRRGRGQREVGRRAHMPPGSARPVTI